MFEEHKKIEFAGPKQMRALQERLLRAHLAYCARKSPYYRPILRKTNVSRLTLADMPSLPLTDKAQLEEFNDDFLAVRKEKIVDIVLSSGTTGRPTRIMYTENDLERLAYNEAQSFDACGMTAKDVVLLTCTIDRCFVAGLAYFLGVRRIGAAAIRAGLASMESHMHVIARMRPTAMIGVPTFMRKLAMHFEENGMDPRKAGVQKLICIGEPLRDERMRSLKLGKDIERLWGAKAYSTYASSEMVTTFCECTAQAGGHLHPDIGIVEIVGEDGRILGAGEQGEVVVTPLGIEGMPLIRFRTGDISFLTDEPCACGRRSVRLGPIIGRKRQMMKVRGTTLYPQAVYSALDRIPGIVEYYVTVSSQDSLSDELTVHAAVQDGRLTAETIGDKLQAALRVKPRVLVVPDSAVREQVYTPKSRKPVRFVDLRKSR